MDRFRAGKMGKTYNTASAGTKILAGWVVRLRTRSLGAVVPAAILPTHCNVMLTGRAGWLNGPSESYF
jgi:hypothetical protein